MYPKGELNWPVPAVVANIERNIRRPLPQVQPHDPQDHPIALVLGGPSLKDTFADLEEKHQKGTKVVSVNGTHDFLLDRGIRPSAHIQLDARRFNARFVKRWQKETKYLLASQCHPVVFDVLKDANVWIYHASAHPQETAVLQSHYLGRYYLIPGGSTVALRALPLLRMLGFYKIEIYGFDSCFMGDEHHAYKQAENDRLRSAEVTVNGRTFKCNAWMHAQAEEFRRMAKFLGDEVKLVVHGDGLIAHMIQEAQ